MRHILCFISILMLSLAVQCQNIIVVSTKALDLEFVLNVNEEGYDVILSVDQEKLEVSEVIAYGIVFIEKDKTNTKELKLKEDNYLEQELTELASYSFGFYNVDSLKYNSTTHYRAYIKYIKAEEEAILYSNVIKNISLYELTKEDDSDFSLSVNRLVENKVLSTFNIALDTKEYTVSTEEENYTVVLDTDYNYITVTISLDEGYLFAEEISLYANGQLVDSSKLSISEDKLIYRFSDPNWTKPY